METLVIVVHVLVALAIIGLILLQQGKGAEAGASFGAGASQTVFGSQGGASFFAKVTAVLAFVFFATSFSLAIIAKNKTEIAVEGVPQVQVAEQAQANDSDVPVIPDELDQASDVPVVVEEVAPVSDVPVVPDSQ